MVSASLLPAGYVCVYFHYTTGNKQTLLVEGPASVQQYQALLSSTTYENALSEPTSGNRSISITVFDGSHRGMTAVLVIVVLVNDNPIQLEAAFDTSITLVEGGNLTSRIGMVAGLVLSDADNEETLTQLSVTLSGAREPGSENIAVVLDGELTESSTSVMYDQPGGLSDYQVKSQFLVHY